jgi:hypothetical protein
MESVRQQLVDHKKLLSDLQDKKMDALLSNVIPKSDDMVAKLVGNRTVIGDYEELKKFSLQLMEHTSEENKMRDEWKTNKNFVMRDGYDYARALAFANAFRARFHRAPKLIDELEQLAQTVKQGRKGYMKKEDRELMELRFRNAFARAQFPPSHPTVPTITPVNTTSTVAATAARMRLEMNLPPKTGQAPLDLSGKLKNILYCIVLYNLTSHI